MMMTYGQIQRTINKEPLRLKSAEVQPVRLYSESIFTYAVIARKIGGKESVMIGRIIGEGGVPITPRISLAEGAGSVFMQALVAARIVVILRCVYLYGTHKFISKVHV